MVYNQTRSRQVAGVKLGVGWRAIIHILTERP